jgi:hypothetical protein
MSDQNDEVGNGTMHPFIRETCQEWFREGNCNCDPEDGAYEWGHFEYETRKHLRRISQLMAHDKWGL